MADLGSIGHNGGVASNSVTFAQYGKANTGGTVSAPTVNSIAQANKSTVSKGAWYGNIKTWSPAAPATFVSGQTQESGVAVAGIPVFLYDHQTGALLGKTVSDGSGNFSIPALGRTSTFVVSTDSPTFNAIIFDQVVPV